MKDCPWSNMRKHTNKEFKWVSSVECLDLLSQTTPGQTMLRKLRIYLGAIVMMRALTGVLTPILRRLRGLQHIEFKLGDGWDAHVITQTPNDYAKFGQGFLRLVKSELGHVKTITIDEVNESKGNEVSSEEEEEEEEEDDVNYTAGQAAKAQGSLLYEVMTFELGKRNKAWVPQSSACESFRTTSSPFQYFSMKSVQKMQEALNGEYSIGD